MKKPIPARPGDTAAREPNEPDDWVAKARRFSRPKVLKAAWSDEEIDRLIKQAQKAVERNPR